MNPPGVHVEWSVNEKVAFEMAAGAAWAGQRALCTMKMSGLNVAYDSLISIAYSGIVGGLVIYVADDPGVSAGHGGTGLARLRAHVRPAHARAGVPGRDLPADTDRLRPLGEVRLAGLCPAGDRQLQFVRRRRCGRQPAGVAGAGARC